MSEKINLIKLLEQIGTKDLWIELARRLNVRFGKIQMAIHEGRPSRYANLDIRVSTDEANEEPVA